MELREWKKVGCNHTITLQLVEVGLPDVLDEKDVVPRVPGQAVPLVLVNRIKPALGDGRQRDLAERSAQDQASVRELEVGPPPGLLKRQGAVHHEGAPIVTPRDQILEASRPSRLQVNDLLHFSAQAEELAQVARDEEGLLMWAKAMEASVVLLSLV